VATEIRLDLRKETFEELAVLVDRADKLADILSVASQMPRQIGIARAAQYISAKVGMHEDDIAQLLTALMNFYHTQVKLKSDSSETAIIITENMRRLAKTDKEVATATKWERASSKIASTISQLSPDHPLEDAYKASRVLSRRQYDLRDSKILTELRPIFNDAGTKITQGVISHTLYLHFHDGSNHHELEILIDATEVTELKRQCERAERKAAVLKDDLKAISWPTSILREPTETN
jgi:hypothetical protein